MPFCSPRRPDESQAAYFERFKIARDTWRQEFVDNFERQKESGRLSPDSDGFTQRELETLVEHVKEDILVDSGMAKASDFDNPREYPRIEYPPGKSLSETGDYTVYQDTFPQMLGPISRSPNPLPDKPTRATRTRAGNAKATLTGSTATSSNKRKRGSTNVENKNDNPSPTKKAKPIDCMNPQTSSQTVPSTSSGSFSSSHHNQRKRRRAEDAILVHETEILDSSHPTKKRKTRGQSETTAAPATKRKRMVSGDEMDHGAYRLRDSELQCNELESRPVMERKSKKAKITNKQMNSNDTHVTPSSTRYRGGRAKQTILPTAPASSSSMPLSSSRITRAQRNLLTGENTCLFELGQRGEPRLQGKMDEDFAVNAASGTAGDIVTDMPRRRRRRVQTRTKVGGVSNTAIDTKHQRHSTSKATIVHVTASSRPHRRQIGRSRKSAPRDVDMPKSLLGSIEQDLD